MSMTGTTARIRNCVAVILLFAAAVPIAAQQSPLAGLDEYVQKGMRDWEVPGLAIAVVKDDKVAYMKSFGVRKLGEQTPVDEHTIFAIGSATKAFTATALGMLVDDGKIKWDDPVLSRLPGFRLADSYLTGTVTIRDLLSHRTGVAANNAVFWQTQFSRDELIDHLQYLDVQSGLRTHFEYNNLMYLTAGQIVPRVSGESWEQFVRERIFVPLGMNSSAAVVADIRDRENVATPHLKIENKIQPIPLIDLTNVAPAGSIHSNLLDMVRWVRLQLSDGTVEGKKLLNSSTLEEMHTPQIFIPQEPPFSFFFMDSHFSAYGLGWMLSDYHGHKIVQHGGDTDGMASMVAMIPDQKLGIVVLTNLEGPWLRSAVMYRVFDAYLGLPATDWNTKYLTTAKRDDDREEAALAKLQGDPQIPGTRPSLPLSEYAGEYADPLYGSASVRYREGKLWLNLLGNSSELDHWNYDTFKVKLQEFNALQQQAIKFVTFELDPGGKPNRIEVPNIGLFKRTIEQKKAP